MSVRKVTVPDTGPRPDPTVRERPFELPARPARRRRSFLPLLFRRPLVVSGFAVPARRCAVQGRAWSRHTVASIAAVASANPQVPPHQTPAPPPRPPRPPTAPP